MQLKEHDVLSQRESIASCIGGSKGAAREVRPALGSKFFHFHAVFSQKK